MTKPAPSAAPAAFVPRRPTLVAGGILTVWVALLSLPMFAGKFLAVYPGDQFAAGYAFRHWLADQIRTTGHIPLWNPTLFGGLPFVGGMHGDIFYPTSWLRLVLPTHIAMDLGFAVHYVLAGLFLYLLLRRLGVSWMGAVTGGLAYQLSGVVASLVSPGHDGKLFVTALMPLALIALIMALRERRIAGYALLALTVGLGILSPHFQMLYYTLIVAGLFSLYLVFGAEDRPAPRDAVLRLGYALGAIVVGFGIGAIQLLPFYAYIPFSPRAVSYGGFEQATSYAIPWSHVLEFFFAGFSGSHQCCYWGPNPLKYHSEYLGLPVIALAVLGAGALARRRLVWWLGGIGALFLLIALGSATPFYQLWWTVMPLVKQTRAPGMAFFVVAFVVASFAAFGVERLERREGKGSVPWWIGIGGAVLLFAIAGGVAEIAIALAEGLGAEAVRVARDHAPAIATGAAVSGLALALLGGLALAWHRGRVPAVALAAGIGLIVGGDLTRAAQGFWRWSDPPTLGLYGGDGVTAYLQQTSSPYRVLDLSDTGLEGYPGSSLMAFGVPQLLGHHGNQLHAFNELMGGKNAWAALQSYAFADRRLWDLFAVRYVILPADYPQILARLPAFQNLEAQFDTAFAGFTAASGRRIHLLERRDPVPWARVVPSAVPLPDQDAIAVLADPRRPTVTDRIVLLDTAATVPSDTITTMPEPMDARAAVTSWEPGHLHVRLDPPPAEAAWLLVAENWYPGWQATVDGTPAPVVRGDVTLITVPLPAGAREVELRFESPEYRTGRLITVLSLLLVTIGFVGPVALRRRRG